MFARCSVVRILRPDTAVDVLELRLTIDISGHKILINNEEVD